MCLGNILQTPVRCAGDAQAAANVKPDLPIPSVDLNLRRSLSVFLFDWDDTLFPTTALTTLGLERMGDALRAVDAIASDLLAAVLSTPNSRLVILTNAKLGWVQHAASSYMPKLNALLGAQDGQVLLISAHRERSEFAEDDYASYEQAVRSSKSDAVHPLSIALRRAVEETQVECFQVVSVGDQPHDLAAAHALRAMMTADAHSVDQESFVKTVAMKPMPTGIELAKQLGTLCRSLPKLLCIGRSFHQSMSYAPASPAAGASVVETPATPKTREAQADCPPSDDALLKAATPSKSSIEPDLSSSNLQASSTSTSSAHPLSMSTKDAWPLPGRVLCAPKRGRRLARQHRLGAKGGC